MNQNLELRITFLEQLIIQLQKEILELRKDIETNYIPIVNISSMR